MKPITKIFHLNRLTEETLSPKQFLNLDVKEKNNISLTKVMPPRLGENGFGRIKVYYKTAVYK